MLRVSLILLSSVLIIGSSPAQTSQDNDRLREALKQYPQADLDKDGVLTMAEAKSYIATMTGGGKGKALPPDFANVSYGRHERNVLDFWKAKSDKPTPVVIFIHGGGFVGGSKDGYAKESNLRPYLDAGVSCVAINYPFLKSMPVQDIMRDCARAVQFVRSKAPEWNLNKSAIAAVGGSAGAGTSLWLATRDDLADTSASDPVLRESSRVCCAVLYGTQATYDVTRWESFLGAPKPEFLQGTSSAEFYHFPNEDFTKSPAASAVLKECDMLSWITKDDAPLLIDNGMDVPAPTNRNEWLHCTQHARAIKKQCESMGSPCIVVQDEKAARPDMRAFLMKHLNLVSS